MITVSRTLRYCLTTLFQRLLTLWPSARESILATDGEKEQQNDMSLPLLDTPMRGVTEDTVDWTPKVELVTSPTPSVACSLQYPLKQEVMKRLDLQYQALHGEGWSDMAFAVCVQALLAVDQFNLGPKAEVKWKSRAKVCAEAAEEEDEPYESYQ